MEKVIFLPRHIASNHVPGDNDVIVSLFDNTEQAAELQPGWRAVLRSRFHDIDQPADGQELMTPQQAQEILEFMESHKDCETLVVHCGMGRNRSGAIALFASELFQAPLFNNAQRIRPGSIVGYNRWVYRLLTEAAYGPLVSAD